MSAAQQQLASGARTVSVALSESSTKVSQAGDPVVRLARQYVDGHASAVRFEAGLRTLNRALETNKIDAAQAEAIYSGMIGRLNAMANGTDIASQGFTRLGAVVDNVNSRMQAAQRHMQAPMAANNNVPGSNAGAMAGVMAGQQFQDIAITAAMGQSLPTIMLQQGPQLGYALSSSLGDQGALGAVKSLGTGLLGLLSPINLVAIGVTGAAAAAIQYFTTSEASSERLEAALKRQKSLVDGLAESYGFAADEARKVGSVGSLGTIFGTRDSALELEFMLREQARAYAAPSIRGQLGRMGIPLIGNDSQFGMSFTAGPSGTTGIGQVDPDSQFKPYEAAIRRLFETARSGIPDFVEFRRLVLERWQLEPNNDALTKTARTMLDATEQGYALAEAYREIKRAQDELARNIDAAGRLRAGEWAQKDMEALRRFQSEERLGIRRSEEAFEADTMGMWARSPAEHADAARARAAAQYNDTESAAARSNRIDLAGRRALIEAEHALAEAQRQRLFSLEQTMDAQQLDLQLVGASAGEAARLRMEHDLTAQARRAAAEAGVQADERELALIREKAAEYGRVAEAIARTKLVRDLQFERDQLFRTPTEQAIAARLRGTGLGLDSPEAAQMRMMAELQAVRAGVTGFFTDFRTALLENGGDLGDALCGGNFSLDFEGIPE